MYATLASLLAVIIIATVIGLIKPIGLFANRRLVALAVLLLVVFGLSPIVAKLKTTTDVKKEQENEKFNAAVKERFDAKGNLIIDATYSKDDYTISGTIQNVSAHPYRNAKAKCVFYGESGKKIETIKIDILKIFPANSTKSFSSIRSGVSDSQVNNMDCKIIDADI